MLILGVMGCCRLSGFNDPNRVPDTDVDAATAIKFRGQLPPIESQTLSMAVNGTTTVERTLTDDQSDFTSDWVREAALLGIGPIHYCLNRG